MAADLLPDFYENLHPVLKSIILAQIPINPNSHNVVQKIFTFVSDFGQNPLNQAVHTLGTTSANFSSDLDYFLGLSRGLFTTVGNTCSSRRSCVCKLSLPRRQGAADLGRRILDVILAKALILAALPQPPPIEWDTVRQKHFHPRINSDSMGARCWHYGASAQNDTFDVKFQNFQIRPQFGTLLKGKKSSILGPNLKVLKFGTKSAVSYVFDPADFDFEVYFNADFKITIEMVIAKLEISFENLKNRDIYVQKWTSAAKNIFSGLSRCSRPLKKIGSKIGVTRLKTFPCKGSGAWLRSSRVGAGCGGRGRQGESTSVVRILVLRPEIRSLRPDIHSLRPESIFYGRKSVNIRLEFLAGGGVWMRRGRLVRLGLCDCWS